MRRQITEQDIAEFRRCPLRGSGYTSDPAIAVAEKLWAMAALASFRGDIWNGPRLRTEIEGLNVQITDRKATPTRIARRVSELLRDWRVIQPVTPYELGYPSAAISGSYAVVAKPKQTDLYVVRLMREQDIYARNLDIASMARWQHHFHAGGESRCFVLQWCVDSTRHFVTSYPLDGVRNQFIALTEQIARPAWAVPGGHCETCRTKGCESWMK